MLEYIYDGGDILCQKYLKKKLNKTEKFSFKELTKLKNNSIINKVDIISYIGAWRSLVARLTGGQEAAGSSPVAPTNKNPLFMRVFAV